MDTQPLPDLPGLGRAHISNRAELGAARRIVVKFGTQVVLDAEGRPALQRIEFLAMLFYRCTIY